ncbi:hypothetical protein BDY19DRAFT_904892 [Irpex rosettiformis]|uniref:Uncharacterized protein n=1 Tax=Irpex rosettiformis TaxID=378272 RepID=A0ACB8U8L9_9APHY|nr:hypothetical protein BDY19DRAFT_904892 [Irpex rosettiformis]
MSARRASIAHHVRVSSVDDISYTVSQAGVSSDTSEAIQTIVTGRKCWKTIKGKGEVVWPPHLEAALVQGLERYRPVDSRSARALGRFPMRNKFISDYIFEITGHRRTPKQVGSRLQQLRDTCEGKRILKLLTHRPEDTPASKPEPLVNSPEVPAAPQPPRDFVNLYVLPPHSPWTSAPSTSATSLDNIPRPLRQISNVVTFRSAKALSAYSMCRVLRNGQAVYRERTELELTQTQAQMSTHYGSDHEYLFLYSTQLVPGYWPSLCECTDVGAFQIVQDIIRAPASPSLSGLPGASSSPGDAVPEILFSVVYQFLNGNSNSPPQSPMSSADGYSYSSASSPEMNGDLDDLTMLDNLTHATLSTPPPHSPPTQRGAYATYSQTSRIHDHSRRLRPYDISPAPGLIRDGEEGYASSLPTSPLDLTFAPLQTQPSAGLGASDSLCGTSFGGVAGASGYSAGFDIAVSGMSGVGYTGSVHSPTNHYSVGVGY